MINLGKWGNPFSVQGWIIKIFWGCNFCGRLCLRLSETGGDLVTKYTKSNFPISGTQAWRWEGCTIFSLLLWIARKSKVSAAVSGKAAWVCSLFLIPDCYLLWHYCINSLADIWGKIAERGLYPRTSTSLAMGGIWALVLTVQSVQFFLPGSTQMLTARQWFARAGCMPCNPVRVYPTNLDCLWSGEIMVWQSVGKGSLRASHSPWVRLWQQRISTPLLFLSSVEDPSQYFVRFQVISADPHLPKTFSLAGSQGAITPKARWTAG